MENIGNINISSKYTDEEEELFDYIASQDENSINNFLSRKKYEIYNFRSKDGKNSNVLHISVYKKNFNIVKLLVDYCKLNFPEKLIQFVNEENSKGISPIHYASFEGNVDIIKLLIENGADITKKTQKKLNIFHYCAQGNMPNSLMYFYLKFRENKTEKNKVRYKLIFEKDGAGSSILHWAVYSIAEDFLLYLINLDIFDSENEKLNFINMQDANGFTALHLCITSKSSRIALKLLQNGADSSLKDANGRTPLDFAINKGEDNIKDILEESKKCQLFRLKVPLKQIKRNYKNVISIFIFQFISLLILFISTLPIVFYKYEYNEYINILFYIFLFLLATFFLLYFLLLIIDPGIKKRRTLEELQNLLKNKVDLTKYCYKCFVLKTRTSKHCIICDCCYDNFDHHCYWINKCVAKNNFVLFIIFLFATALYLIICFILVILGLINITILSSDNFDSEQFCEKHYIFKSFKSDELCKILYTNNFVLHLAINILLTLIILIFLIPECFLLILHINIVFSNYKAEKINKKASIRISTSPLLNENEESSYNL